MRVELYGLARARAGRACVDVPAGSLAEVLAAAARSCPGLVPDVIRGDALSPGFVASRNGDAFLRDPSAAIRPRDTLLILSSDAGG